MAIVNNSHYAMQAVITPSTLTANTVYLSIRNISVSPTAIALGFVQLQAQYLFTGTAAATGSLFGIQRVTATPTGGSVITPASMNPAASLSQTEIRFSNAGLSTVTPNGIAIYHFGGASQVGSTKPPTASYEDENPFLISPGDCLIVYAHTGIVTGSAISVQLRWFQVL